MSTKTKKSPRLTKKKILNRLKFMRKNYIGKVECLDGLISDLAKDLK